MSRDRGSLATRVNCSYTIAHLVAQKGLSVIYGSLSLAKGSAADNPRDVSEPGGARGSPYHRSAICPLRNINVV